MQTRSKTIFVTGSFALVWIGAVGFGLAALSKYEKTPGKIGEVPSRWPVNSLIQLATSGKTLVMLAHPRCPCTRASVEELAQIMARVQGKARAYVLLLKPKNADVDWDDTDLRHSAAGIPGVTVITDVDGAQARRLGAETSGHTFLFDSNGQLLFSGGITESRGHVGDNIGESAIVSLVNGRTAEHTSTFVFGCALVDRSHKEEKKTPCLH